MFGQATLALLKGALLLGVIAAAGCGHKPAAPSGYLWNLPVYPNAAIAGKSTAKASFVLYRTPDSLDDVYNWYVAQLPRDTPHAYSALKQQATFALFDAHARRTVHIKREGASTVIFLTKLME